MVTNVAGGTGAAPPPAVEDASSPGAPRLGESIYLYTPGVRIWHWVTVLCIIGLSVTGYLIGSAPPTIQGEASDSFFFGYIRTIHFVLAYVLSVGMLYRIFRAVVARGHAAEIFWVPLWNRQFLQDLLKMFRWYAFGMKQPMRWRGHNPLARLSLAVLFVLVTLFMIASGFALYAEGAGMRSWQEMVFGWVRSLAGSSMTLHTWHHLGMWALLVFFVVHLYSVVRDDIMGASSTLSSMISGWRTYRERR